MLGFLTILLAIFFGAAISAGMLTWMLANPGVVLASIIIVILIERLKNNSDK